jgi:hypothetical protein
MKAFHAAEASSPYKKTSSKSQHEILHLSSFLPAWFQMRINNPEPDPQTRLNPDPNLIRIRIRRTGENHKMFMDLSLLQVCTARSGAEFNHTTNA